jgi:hypothetical protein
LERKVKMLSPELYGVSLAVAVIAVVVLILALERFSIRASHPLGDAIGAVKKTKGGSQGI